MFVLCVSLVTWFQTAAEAGRNTTTSTEMTCKDNASCVPGVDHSDTCFCDRLCRVYSDCCPDYVDEEGARQLMPLPSSSFACSFVLHYPVYIITECPPTYDVQFVRDNCRRGSATARPPSSETFYVVPVSSRTSGLVYRNVYCAVCHAEDDVGFWSVKTKYCNEPESVGVRKNIDDLRQQSFGSCTFSFSPVSDVPLPRRCVDSVTTCPDDANAEVASRCALSSNVAYVYKRLDDTAYRNRDCAECHGMEDHDLSCSSSSEATGRKPPPDALESFAIIFDINTGTGSTVRTQSGKITQSLASCPQRHVYDPFMGSCRMVTCPPGHSFTENGQCQSRQSYRTQTGPPIMKVIWKNTTFGDQTDDYDCAWIQFNSSEYQVLLNRSIYVRLHDATYDSYRLGENQTAYVCTPFQRNYTATIHEALRVDAVGAYLSLVCSVISLVALAFQFAVYMAFPSLRNTPGRCIICLVVSLFVGQLLFLLVKTGSSVSFGFCFGQAAVMHFAFLAAFFWMNVMAFDIYRTFSASPGAAVSSSQSGARRRFAGYSAYVWVSAAVVVAVGVAMDLADVGGTYRPHYGYRICWFGSRGGLLVLFGVPVGVLLVINIILFCLSVRQIRNTSKASQMAVQDTDQTPLMVSMSFFG